MSNIKLFESKKVRRHWDKDEEKWYFSVIDVVAILTDSANPRDYWFKMKTRIQNEDGAQLSTICRQLKLEAADNKKYLTVKGNDFSRGMGKEISRPYFINFSISPS